jgi:6-phosphogluconolactonase
MMKIAALAASLAVVSAAHARTDLVYFGSTGVPPDGARFPTYSVPNPKDGVYAAKFDEATGKFTPIGEVSQLLRPSMVLVNPKMPVLYAVNELGGSGGTSADQNGQLVSYRYDFKTGALTQLGVADAGGKGTNYISLDLASKTFFLASYASGQVSSLPMNADGTAGPVASIDTHTDKGTGPPRQEAAHAHAAVLDPTGHWLLSPDLGTDRVYVYKFDARTHKLTPAPQPSVTFPTGAGTRHVLFLKGGKFAIVNSEISAQLFVMAWDAKSGTLSLKQTIDTLPPGMEGKGNAGDMELSPDGTVLYVDDRRDATVASYRVDAKAGTLTAFDRVPSGGKLPWALAIDPSGHWLLVANDTSNQITTFKIGPDGKLTATGETLDVQAPCSIAFVTH